LSRPTPEFVRWTLGRPCPLREDYDWTDPEHTERLLRPVREVGRARREGRTVEGVALLDPPPLAEPYEAALGFVIEEALAVFGGEAEVISACGACPANAAALVSPDALAGCYGMFYLAGAAALHEAVEDSIAGRQRNRDFEDAFPDWRPRWYGFWLTSPLSGPQMSLLIAILEEVHAKASSAAPGLGEFLRGLGVSRDRGLPLYVRLIPSGRQTGDQWKLDSHCRRCRAPRPLRDPKCRVCGVRGEVCAGRTRNIQGRRPYQPLIRQLGPQKLRELVEYYNRRTDLS
jgi:hypothetical protein